MATQPGGGGGTVGSGSGSGSATSTDADIAALWTQLESTRPEEVAEARTRFADLLAAVREGWFVSGLISYYAATGSMRAVDLLAKAPPPHDRYLLERVTEGLRSGGGTVGTGTGTGTGTALGVQGSQPGLHSTWRIHALALLGHVLRRHPSWLHTTFVNSSVLKELLHLLKTERDIVPLMSGLLVLVTLLPMIPTLVSLFFPDIFEVFNRLAAWECRRSHDPAPSRDGHKEHLQLAMYALFQNLYGMFPCNFLDFLRREYGKSENGEVFAHTVKPMLESVKLHSLLVTSSKAAETDANRWKKMEHHDIVVECCRRFSSENPSRHRHPEDGSSFRSRCGTDVSSLAVSSDMAQIQSAKASNSTPNLTEPPADPLAALKRRDVDIGAENWFSLAEVCGAAAPSAPQTPLPLPVGAYHDSHIPSQIQTSIKRHDGGSPPEAAIEATPENTPIKDAKSRFHFPTNSPAVRALGNRPPQTQPGQPFQVHASSYSQPPSPLKKELSPFNRMSSVDNDEPRVDGYLGRLTNVIHERNQQTADSFSNSASPLKQSPLKKSHLKDNLRSFPSQPNSPVPIGVPTSGTSDWPSPKPKPQAQRDGGDLDRYCLENIAPPDNREDREIAELSRKGETLKVCRDGLFGDFDKSHHRHLDGDAHEDGEEHWTEEDTTCTGPDSNCAIGGLHMPPMLVLAKKVARRRFNSNCIVEPMNCSVPKSSTESAVDKTRNVVLRRSSSCPEFNYKKYDYTKLKPDSDDSDHSILEHGANFEMSEAKYNTQETQTVEVWPLTYEHMFTDILQNVCDQNAKLAEISVPEESFDQEFSPYSQIDKFVEVLKQSKDSSNRKDEVHNLKQQLELLHLELQYERHRREVHAFRNRRLLGRFRKNRAAEEQNLALKQQVNLFQSEIDDLRKQMGKQKLTIQNLEEKQKEDNKYWQRQLSQRDSEIVSERSKNVELSAQLHEQKSNSNDCSGEIQSLRSELFEVSQQLERANRKSEITEKHMEFAKKMQRELLIYGERDAKYREVFLSPPSKTDVHTNKTTRKYREQLVNAQTSLQQLSSKLEMMQGREAELEAAGSTKEMVIQELKKQLRLVKEEYSEKLKSVEDKYQSVKRINQRLEAHCLELLQRVPQSPQTISRDLTSGFSPQSSLSASLASSEGQGPLLSRVDEMRNLQVILNTHETIEESNSNSVNNTALDDDAE